VPVRDQQAKRHWIMIAGSFGFYTVVAARDHEMQLGGNSAGPVTPPTASRTKPFAIMKGSPSEDAARGRDPAFRRCVLSGCCALVNRAAAEIVSRCGGETFGVIIPGWATYRDTWLLVCHVS
jgi:hypothetical protein